jgi:tRNA1Val (adenine37-N6)-methyltransferase
MREETTLDSLFGGRLVLAQPKRGYRVNVDALLLAAFAAAHRRRGRVVDLGAGVGAVGLALHDAGLARELHAVECEPLLAALLRENLARSGVVHSVFERDLAAGLPRALVQKADLVVANPPFFEPGSGRTQQHPRTARGRTGVLAPFVDAAARALAGPRARAAFVYPAAGLPRLLSAADAAGLVAKRLRFVHARADTPARVALLELRRAKPGGLIVEPPLVEWLAPRERSDEVAALVERGLGQRAKKPSAPRP